MLDKEQQYSIKGHDNEFGHKRNFTFYVRFPADGVNDQTGVLLILQNLNARANDKYWHDIRKRWADRYNVVAVGVNYQGAGWTGLGVSKDYSIPLDTLKQLNELLPPELRRGPLETDPEELLSHFNGQDLTKYGIVFGEAHSFEFWKSYPDYGFIQAIDCLWALGAVWQIFENDGRALNKTRTYLYGVNEGGHIAQMCGRFAPDTFALIVDNSGYPFISVETMLGKIKADYEKRTLSGAGTNISVLVEIPRTYGVSKGSRYYITEDMIEIRDLKRYIVKTNTKYVVIQTDGDSEEKRAFCEEMVKQGIDLEYIVKEYGLDSENLISVFEDCADKYLLYSGDEVLPQDTTGYKPETRIIFNTVNGRFVVDYSSGAPHIKFEGKTIVLRLAEEG